MKFEKNKLKNIYASMQTKSNISILILILLTACSHTNKLANYDLQSKKFALRNDLSSNTRQMTISFVTSSKNKKDSSGAILNIFTDVISEAKKRELINSVDTQNLIDNISYGMYDALETYLDANIIDEKEGNYDFLVENTLRKCDLNISKNAVKIGVSSVTRIIDLATATVVWENRESKSIPMSSIISTDKIKFKSVSEEEIYILQKLFSLSKEELNQKIGLAGEYIGRDMGETLRRDIAESHSKE